MQRPSRCTAALCTEAWWSGMQYTVNDDNWAMDGGLSGLPVMENEYRCAPRLPCLAVPPSNASTGKAAHGSAHAWHVADMPWRALNLESLAIGGQQP